MAAKPRRSSIKPTPRPLPPPGDDEDDVFHFSQRLQRTQPLIFSPDMGIALPQNQEPDLPPVTPDVVSSTPPRGIHSSPSRWREKNRQKKTSPLKPAPERPEKAGPSKTLTSRGPKRLSEMAAQSKNKPGTDPSTSAARNVPEHDPNAAKKNERDALLEDIAQMKSALESIEAENERIRFMQKSGRVLTLNDADVVSDLVQQYLMSQAPQARDRPSQQLLKLALNPKSLLPFGKPSKPIATVSDDAEDWASIKSHHPVAMTAEEEVPFLELFTFFSIGSTIAMLPSTPDHELRQRYSMKFRSRSPPGLFNARVEMTVNAKDLSILELGVPALEPSAKFELMPFIDKICNGDCNRSMQRNVGIVSWAMGEWYRVATHRALLWAQLERDLSTKEALAETTGTLRSRKSKRPRDEDEESADEPVACSTAELLRFMGQQTFDVNVPLQAGGSTSPTARLEWKIDFDWTGEAQSKLSVKIGVPGKWHHQDQRGAIGRISKLFDELVEGGEKPAFAAQTIVALLGGEEA
jgi:hypothetical protein